MKTYRTLMIMNAIKKYDNGAAHSTIIRDSEVKAYQAKIDAEDKIAGLVGYWEIEVRTVY